DCMVRTRGVRAPHHRRGPGFRARNSRNGVVASRGRTAPTRRLSRRQDSRRVLGFLPGAGYPAEGEGSPEENHREKASTFIRQGAAPPLESVPATPLWSE